MSKVFLLRILILFSFLLFTYSIIFPGLFESNFSYYSFFQSIFVRVLDIANTIGFEAFQEFFYEEAEIAYSFTDNDGNKVITEDSYFSLISLILKSDYLLPLSVIILSFIFYIITKIKKFNKEKDHTYFNYFILISLLLSQFAVPFISAPSFQFLIGYSISPLFYTNSR